MDVLGAQLEESPFRSILHSCWAVMTTITTVGYGDMFPTSTPGKVISSFSMVIGLLVVALPITVIGGAFAREVQQHEAHGDQNRQLEKVHYKGFLLQQLAKCTKEGLTYRQISRKLRLIELHEHDVHVSSEEEKVPGAGGADFVVLTLARKVQAVELACEKIQKEVHKVAMAVGATGGGGAAVVGGARVGSKPIAMGTVITSVANMATADAELSEYNEKKIMI
jgi:hypothetical protein